MTATLVTGLRDLKKPILVAFTTATDQSNTKHKHISDMQVN